MIYCQLKPSEDCESLQLLPFYLQLSKLKNVSSSFVHDTMPCTPRQPCSPSASQAVDKSMDMTKREGDKKSQNIITFAEHHNLSGCLPSSSTRNLLSTTTISSLTTTWSYLRSLSTNTTGQVFGKRDVYLFTLQRGWYLVATAPFIDKYIIVHYSGEWLKPLPCFALKNVFAPLQLPLAEQIAVLVLPLRD